jgi:hypothetical protein
VPCLYEVERVWKRCHQLDKDSLVCRLVGYPCIILAENYKTCMYLLSKDAKWHKDNDGKRKGKDKSDA